MKTLRDYINLIESNKQGVAEATPRHFGPKGAGTELARQIRANGELDRNKQPKPTGIPKKNEFNITEPKAKIQVKKDKGVAEMDKSQKGPAGWNIDDYDYSKGKWTQGKPVTAKQATSDMEQELTKAFSSADKKKPKPVKESYWTKLQNERNTRLNTLVNELKEITK